MGIKNHIKVYTNSQGKAPFIIWLTSLDKTVRYRVKERLDRVALGNLGDYKSLVEGVCELRLKFGPGYRIYYAKDDGDIILLLCGGDKSSQKSDLKEAIAHWRDYLAR